jgi:hypothetical protein
VVAEVERRAAKRNHEDDEAEIAGLHSTLAARDKRIAELKSEMKCVREALALAAPFIAERIPGSALDIVVRSAMAPKKEGGSDA